MIVTIDGPAGAGKSSVAKELAKRLGFRFLDTGAMYRAVTYTAVLSGHDWEQADELAKLASGLRVELQDNRVLLNGEDVTRAIRASSITGLVYHAANNPAVREVLVAWQRAAAEGKNVVTEGRDQGTVVFPDAECKIFLTATAEERARRRLRDLLSRGEEITFEKVLADQNERDRRDSTRSVGPLKPATDAQEVVTDGMSPAQVLDRLENLVRQRQARDSG